MKKLSLFASLGLAAAVGMTAPAYAENDGLEVGVLTCNVVPGSRINLLVRSTADVVCEFENDNVTETYVGETGIALGLDLSFRENETIAFTVIAATSDTTPGGHALAGQFVGGEISAAAGFGLGAKALVGGGDKSFGLQPLAVETSTGIGISGGLGFLYLEPHRANSVSYAD